MKYLLAVSLCLAGVSGWASTDTWKFMIAENGGTYSKVIGTSNPKTGEVTLYKDYQPTQRDIMILIKSNQNAWKYFEKRQQEELDILHGKKPEER